MGKWRDYYGSSFLYARVIIRSPLQHKRMSKILFELAQLPKTSLLYNSLKIYSTMAPGTGAEGKQRSHVKPGATVQVVLKQDQRTGKLTEGVVASLLTNSANHPHGIKVKLRDGQVGRVQNIISP